jgi:hypothetical protein
MGREGKDSVFMRYTCVLPFYLLFIYLKREFFLFLAMVKVVYILLKMFFLNVDFKGLIIFFSCFW